MLEKVGGFLTIVIAVAGLALISAFQPPTYVQILGALVGSMVCLVGVVFLFANHRPCIAMGWPCGNDIDFGGET